jgi:hypothetical protein
MAQRSRADKVEDGRRLGASVTACRCMFLTGDRSTRQPAWRVTPSICSGRTPMWRSPTSTATAPTVVSALSRPPNRRDYIHWSPAYRRRKQFVDDSPLEGAGFEPSVPLVRQAPELARQAPELA